MDWRLPNIDELKTLRGNGQSKLGDTGWFWSSSTLSDFPNLAWLVDFDYGRVDDYNKSGNYYVRCVR